MKPNLSFIPKEFNPPITNTAYFIRKRLLKYIIRYAPHLSGSIMDFGCGSKPYRSLFHAKEYIGVDYYGEGHSHKNEPIDVFYDGIHLPFENDRFDGIFSTEVFEHVFNLEHIIKELNRVLKPGGKMLITCPFAICEHEVPNDFARYTSYGLKDLLERNDFEIIAFEKAGSAIETVTQLFASYFYTHILRKYFGKIPVVRTALHIFFTTIVNSTGLLLHTILPSGSDLYMNNIVVVMKK